MPNMPTSFSDNLSMAAQAMKGSDKEDDKKKDDNDPMLDYGKQLVEFAKNMTGGSDTEMNPMSMIQKGMDFLNSYDSDAKESNKSSTPDLGKDAVNTESLETAATLAM